MTRCTGSNALLLHRRRRPHSRRRLRDGRQWRCNRGIPCGRTTPVLLLLLLLLKNRGRMETAIEHSSSRRRGNEDTVRMKAGVMTAWVQRGRGERRAMRSCSGSRGEGTTTTPSTCCCCWWWYEGRRQRCGRLLMVVKIGPTS